MRTFVNFVAIALFAGLGALGCGAGGEAQPPAAAPSIGADAGAAGSNANQGQAPPPSDVTIPPVRPVPPLSLGSKVAHVRGRVEPANGADALGDPRQPPCVASAGAGAPEATVQTLARTCAPSMKAAGSPHALSMGERDPAVVVAMVATRACYRVFAASPSGVDGFVVVILDSKGAVAAEGRSTNGHALAVPAEGPLCFDADDAAKVMVSTGRGTGMGSMLIVKE